MIKIDLFYECWQLIETGLCNLSHKILISNSEFIADLDDDGSDKNRTETPPPSYDEALAISNNDNLFVNLPPSTSSPQGGATSLPPPPPIDDQLDDRPLPPPAPITVDNDNNRSATVVGRPFDV